ncbi:nitrogen regulation protein NR(I) [Vibrio nigripulchritudo ATCC 27043]|uniref:DNA-binding transcriptional regulator NtrC n=2 Tax=Vibrio nigripulchritudo TaxID=28173 RepID=U4KFG8_9VIBR|nr:MULTISPECIES: nitrogen regulation protein NR(I) [Vibrio]EGU56292.1 nitrogen regulation protein NR(I) [Vibrio nigripulchritudo ATCC 27043]KJY69789.1 nitrogen regulation protein NR(I) [Vibrio nigripulchritudo]UAB70281.1 nitrogen regulation protein NR(I) [Vibrio sp. SCSIO 43132]CCN36128.1 Nitrogen regulation protein NR(I) [Vibrio nigripulchritudo AM115]CCN39920.1 Nitrogen regulation protein NR(I) [Vibrio nigripulchritudo FTn2]
MSKGYVWVVDDDSSIRWVMEKTLSSAQIQCETFADAESVLMAFERQVPDVLVSDIRMPGIDGLDLLKEVHQQYPDLPVIIMTAHSDLDAAVNAYQKGAFEYLPKPFDIDETLTLVERAIAHSHEQRKHQSTTDAFTSNAPEIIGEAPAMQEVFRAIGRLSRSSISVLINGESGTGKELVAHALHRHSPRAKNPFIALNMAAIPKDLIESELFGHEKGAFTGANTVRQGRFEQANGGTLFLDEIGDMPLDIQTRLLRVLADGQFYRVGGHSPINVDVRIIAATHQNLEKLVHEGDFREDLFHRLNVIRVHIPALRERKQDIEKLAQHFLSLAAEELGVEMKTLHTDTIANLNQLPWPGNVRQLENICRWLTVMASGNEVLPSDLPRELFEDTKTMPTSHENGGWQSQLEEWAKEALTSGETEILSYALPEFERILLKTALNHTNGHKQDAAKVLGWGRNTLTRKLKELNIQ